MPSRGRAIAASLSAAVFLLLAPANLPAAADSNAWKEASSSTALSATIDSAAILEKLERGDVVIDFVEEAKTKFVVGKVLVKQPPEVVWPILVNPFEFQDDICPKMKMVEVLRDQPDSSVLRCSIDVCFLFPTIKYTVESTYDPARSVEFHRLSGSLKDFRGCWLLRPCHHGACTEVMYSMYVDPGIPLPRWLIREGVKSELPKTLTGLRDRVNAIAAQQRAPLQKTLAAAAFTGNALISQRQDCAVRSMTTPSAHCSPSAK